MAIAITAADSEAKAAAVKDKQNKLQKKNIQRAESLKKLSAKKADEASFAVNLGRKKLDSASAASRNKLKTNKILGRLEKIGRKLLYKIFKTKPKELDVKHFKPIYRPEKKTKIFKDERYKYTAIYYFKPFLKKLIVFLTYFVSCQIWDFWKLFVNFNTVRLVLLLLFVPMCFICFPSFIDFGKIFIMRDKINKHMDDIKQGRVTTIEGEPGTGKTTLLHYEGYHLAYYSWKDFQVLFFKQLNKFTRCNFKFKTEEEKWRWQDFKKGYSFYKNNEKKIIPLLFENTPLKEKKEFGGRYSYVLEKEHFLQKKRLPEGAVLVKDEAADDLGHNVNNSWNSEKTKKEKKAAGEWLPRDEYSTGKDLLNEFMSKERHFLDAYIFFAEQSAKENFIGIRRVTTRNIYLTLLEKVLEPKKMLRTIDKLNMRILCTHGKVDNKVYDRAADLEKQSQKIGFLKLNYRLKGNLEQSEAILKEGYFILPKNQPTEFETRSFYFDYKARNMPLECISHKTLYKSSYKKRAVKAQSSRSKVA